MRKVLFILGIEDSHRVLMRRITSAGGIWELHGSIDLFEDLNHPQLQKQVVVVGGADRVIPDVERPDLVFNCITDADASMQALGLAQQLIQRFPGVPVINAPAMVARTRRDDVAAALAGIPGLVVPATVRITPRSHRELLDAIAAGPGYPAIVRRAGTHGGTSMLLLQSEADRGLLEQIACDGSEYYLVRFVDFASADGLYRKLRLVFVGDQVFARHLLVSTHWNVHASTRGGLMTERPELAREEEQFLSTFGPATFPALAERLGAVAGALRLQYFSMDCALLGNGDLLLFEANASGNALRQAGVEQFPCLGIVVQRLRAAVLRLLLGPEAS